MRIKQITNRLNSQIKESLEDQDLLQKEYAKRIQLTQSTFSNYVTGTREMPYEVLSQIADDFDIDLNYIFKTNAKKMVTLSHEEQIFFDSLKHLTEQERTEIYKCLNTLIGFRK